MDNFVELIHIPSVTLITGIAVFTHNDMSSVNNSNLLGSFDDAWLRLDYFRLPRFLFLLHKW